MTTPMIGHRPAIDEAPKIVIKTAEFLLHLKKLPGVDHCSSQFQAIPDDAGIRLKGRELSFIIAGDTFWIELVKDFPIARTLTEYGLPTQARLCPFQYQKLEQLPIIMHRHAPLDIMVFDVKRGLWPCASLHTVHDC